MQVRDSQKSKVYKWEQEFVSPFDTMPVKFEAIKPIVDYVWDSEGLKHPPLVSRLPKQNKRCAATGSRLDVRFQDETYTWIILHELAHSMTGTFDGYSNHHGALYMGIYIQLLSRYLKLPFGELVKSAQQSGLAVKLDARPVFL